MEHLWGIDLGGTKVEGAIIQPGEEPQTICRLRIPTESDRGYEHIVARIAEVVELLSKDSGLLPPPRIGIGTPGTVDPVSGLMKNCNTTVLNGKPLPADLERTLAREVRLENDANCFALAEATWGAGRGEAVVFGVIIGTGVGGGIVVNGKTIRGAQGIAGEWGHNVLDPAGKPCYCGKHGCIETVLSGPALERCYEVLCGERLQLREIVSRARSGQDAEAAWLLENLCENFGRAVAVVVNILDPDVIVLGGGVGNIDELYTVGAAKMRPWIFSDVVHTRLARPRLGDSAGVYGAAMLSLS